MGMFDFLFTILQFLGWGLLIAGVIITGVSFYNNIDDETRATLVGSVEESPLDSGWKALTFLFSYQLVTPAITYDWLGAADRHVWLLEELPLPDSRDIIGLFFIAWLPWWAISRFVWQMQLNPAYKILIIIAGLIIFTLVGWLLIKTIAFWAMHSLSGDLGIDADTLRNIRAEEAERLDENIGFGRLLFITGLFGLVLLMSLLPNKKEG